MTSRDSKPLRRDAEENLRRIRAAARDVFAEQGYGAPMQAIATRAGVGVGTLYRCFATKAELMRPVVKDARRRNREVLEEVLADAPPGDEIFEFVRRCMSTPSVWRVTIADPPWGSKRGAELTVIDPRLTEIVERSKAAGTLRADVEVTDVVVLLTAARSIADLCDRPGSKPSRRFLELSLDGLRPGHPAIPQPPLSTEKPGRTID
jgi:AcrR family transcriptional regulator